MRAKLRIPSRRTRGSGSPRAFTMVASSATNAAAQAAAARSPGAADSSSAWRSPAEPSHRSCRMTPAIAAAARTHPSSSSFAESSWRGVMPSGAAIWNASLRTTGSGDARSSDSMAANASGAALARAAAANSRVWSSPPRTKSCSSATCSVVGRPTACWKSARLNAWVRSLA